MFGLQDNYLNSLEQNSEKKQNLTEDSGNDIFGPKIGPDLQNFDSQFIQEKEQIIEKTVENIFEGKVKILVENIDKNINELLKYIGENYKGNEKILRKIFLTEIGEEEYQLNYYNNQRLLVFLNAKILFGDYASLKSGNINYFKDETTGDFKDKNGNKLLIYRDSIISTSFLEMAEDGLNITIERHDKDFPLEYVGSRIIYLTIDDVAYGEYLWDIVSNKYILQDHKDGENGLIIEKGKKYTVTLNNKVINESYESLLSQNLKKEEIIQLYAMFTEKETETEKIKDDILAYLYEKIKDNNLLLNNNEYVYYIDKSTQKSFLAYYSSKKLEILGYDKISTGNLRRNGAKKRYFETPNLVLNRKSTEVNDYEKTIYSGDWRAEGTDSKGYGKEGSKIFNLGEYHIDGEGNAYLLYGEDESGKGYIYRNGKKVPAYINFHLAMHKTTPWATTQLGRKLSQGCIRSTPFSIDLLDSQKLLDGKKGKYIIIGNYDESKDIISLKN